MVCYENTIHPSFHNRVITDYLSSVLQVVRRFGIFSLVEPFTFVGDVATDIKINRSLLVILSVW